MPVLTNSIGEFEFLQMDGTPFYPQERLELIERAGVDGVGVRRLGEAGKPFEITTTNYEVSYATARSKMELYKWMVGDGPVELVRHSVAEGYFVVLGVAESQRFPIFNSIGGLYGNEEICHVVTWTLVG